MSASDMAEDVGDNKLHYKYLPIVYVVWQLPQVPTAVSLPCNTRTHVTGAYVCATKYKMQNKCTCMRCSFQFSFLHKYEHAVFL